MILSLCHFTASLTIMEEVSVCLSFDFLGNRLSNRLNTWRVYCWEPEEVQRRVWSCLDQQNHHSLESCKQQHLRPSSRPVLNRHISNRHCTAWIEWVIIIISLRLLFVRDRDNYLWLHLRCLSQELLLRKSLPKSKMKYLPLFWRRQWKEEKSFLFNRGHYKDIWRRWPIFFHVFSKCSLPIRLINLARIIPVYTCMI